MMLGLKRDLRREGEGIIYPQEVRDYEAEFHALNWLTEMSRPIVLRRNFVAIDTPSARLSQASCSQRLLKILLDWRQ
jgi:hypothetical protein